MAEKDGKQKLQFHFVPNPKRNRKFKKNRKKIPKI